MQSDHHGRLTTWCEPANSSSSQAGRQQLQSSRQAADSRQEAAPTHEHVV